MAEKKETQIVAQPTTVKQWLSSDYFKDAVKAALPQHVTPERFVRVALTALMKTPKLAECSQESILKVMLDLSSLGLEPDGRRAHIIPYGKTAQLIIDYKGLIELAKRSGEVEMWRAEIVCENDGFVWQDGEVHHQIDFFKPRGKVMLVYSHIKNKNGLNDFEVMTMAQVEAIRKRSKAGDSGPWVTDFNEMAKKTVIRRHSKRLTLSPEVMDAIAKDFDSFDEIEPPVNMPKRLSDKQAENDPEPIDQTPPQDAEAAPQSTKPPEAISEAQHKRLMAIAGKNGVTHDQLKDYILVNYDLEHTTDISRDVYDNIVKWVEGGEK